MTRLSDEAVAAIDARLAHPPIQVLDWPIVLREWRWLVDEWLNLPALLADRAALEADLARVRAALEPFAIRKRWRWSHHDRGWVLTVSFSFADDEPWRGPLDALTAAPPPGPPERENR